jgi:hypothetical protein
MMIRTAIPTLALAAALAAQGSARLEPPVRLEADGAVIDTGPDIAHGGPLVADWDGDGLQDLLVSAFRGNIRFFRNTGTRTQPEFTEGDPLEAGGAPLRIHNW